MSNKEFQEMLELFTKLDTLLKKYESSMIVEESTDVDPILIPDDVYDEICDELDIDHIDLLGVS